MSMLNIHKDIRQSATLPADFYRNPAWFEKSKEAIFASSWQYISDANIVREKGEAYPFTLLPNMLNEPLVLVQGKDDKTRCLSNVCTHRGKIIVEKPSKKPLLSCGYHGRCFRLDGTFKSMPEFKEVVNFPTKADDLAQIPLKKWAGLNFISLHPKVDFEEMIRPMQERIGWMPLDTMTFREEGTKDYPVAANWALYCDNYLEGFHVPFVHPALNEALDFQNYDYETFPYCNLQIGIAGEGEPHFDLPKISPDYGRKVYAYYFWLFPNLMFNFYPWGLSLNVVTPINHQKTVVSFRTYQFENQELSRTVYNMDRTEMEDEEVVESVQLGVQSRFYHSGRFSPSMEKAVHHFHTLVADWLPS